MHQTLNKYVLNPIILSTIKNNTMTNLLRLLSNTQLKNSLNKKRCKNTQSLLKANTKNMNTKIKVTTLHKKSSQQNKNNQTKKKQQNKEKLFNVFVNKPLYLNNLSNFNYMLIRIE